MKTEAQIKEFIGRRMYCECCCEFRDDLKYEYEFHGLVAAQEFCKNYKNVVCGALDNFLYLS